jgi:hypothetical protein
MWTLGHRCRTSDTDPQEGLLQENYFVASQCRYTGIDTGPSDPDTPQRGPWALLPVETSGNRNQMRQGDDDSPDRGWSSASCT